MSRLPAVFLSRLVVRVLARHSARASGRRSMPWSGSRRIGQAAVPELLDQEGDALVAVAAMRVAGMRQKADQRLVELHALGRLRTVGRDRALGALRRDRARAVGEQQADQRLEGEQVVGRRARGRAARRTRSRSGLRVQQELCVGDAAEARPARVARHRPTRRSACRTAAATRASSRPSAREMRLRISGPHASVVADRGQHGVRRRMAG